MKKFRKVRFNRALPCLSDSLNQLKLKGRSKSLDLKHLSVRSPCYWLHHDWLRNLLVVFAKAVFKQTASLVALLLRGRRRRRRSRFHALALVRVHPGNQALKLHFGAELLLYCSVLLRAESIYLDPVWSAIPQESLGSKSRCSPAFRRC